MRHNIRPDPTNQHVVVVLLLLIKIQRSFQAVHYCQPWGT
jgi:hypothetical protein